MSVSDLIVCLLVSVATVVLANLVIAAVKEASAETGSFQRPRRGYSDGQRVDMRRSVNTRCTDSRRRIAAGWSAAAQEPVGQPVSGPYGQLH